ncbi:MAG: hypothetical protein IH586_05675 [Anaerolineaceae bacterium]|nr:hypothetical protein [Anaerolineaceae bacterium]
MQWLKKNRVHLLIWAILFVYLLTSNQIYTTFFLKNGKPLKGFASLPAEKSEVRFSIDRLEPIIYEGEELYKIHGWVFVPQDENSPNYRKKIVFHSVSEDLVFQAEVYPRPDLNKVLTEYKMTLDNSGFTALISKNALKLENFRIGFILENEQGDVMAYRLVNVQIERQRNGLRLIHGD